MISELFDYIAGQIKEATGGANSWVTLNGGLAQTITITIGDRKKRIPAYYNTREEEDPCRPGEYLHLHPDDAQALIVYHEITGERPGRRLSIGHQRIIDFRTVVWVNTRRISETPEDIANYITRYMLAIPFNHGGDLPFVSYKLTYKGQENDMSVFSKYDFDESETQMLMHPYYSISILWSLSFINKGVLGCEGDKPEIIAEPCY